MENTCTDHSGGRGAVSVFCTWDGCEFGRARGQMVVGGMVILQKYVPSGMCNETLEKKPLQR